MWSSQFGFVPSVSQTESDGTWPSAQRSRHGVFELATSTLAVTPNAELAGEVREVGDNLTFYVAPEQFETFESELAELVPGASGTLPSVRPA